MATYAFRERLKEPRVYGILRVFTILVLALWIPLALYSGYRAIVQVFALEVHTSSTRLEVNSVVQAEVITSGRATVDVRLELVQNGRAVTLGLLRVSGNAFPSLDPRPSRGSLRVAVAREHMSGLRAGSVIVRATAMGRSQFLRVPPATVRERALTLRADSADPMHTGSRTHGRP